MIKKCDDLKMNSRENIYCHFFASPFQSIAIVWTRTSGEVKIRRIILPNGRRSASELVNQIYPSADIEKCDQIHEIADNIVRFLNGEDIHFSLNSLDWDCIKPFQKKVLLAEYDVPRGWITTYQRLAAHLDNPKAARAVGNALRNNPFPIIIPCHRAIRSDGTPGGFQGGSAMKQILLELEGIKFSSAGRILNGRYYY